ncbi:hypothetical protein [Streptomyces sp. NPDC003077]|uniref:hypothetical protein n=1 Tax=Streptomyces sp. NPDC003077 TaxID=3154443 RepID=UPI0033A485A0
MSEQNGLYYHPFLREEPAGPEAESYALRTLSALGSEPKISSAGARVSSFRNGALEASPLWGRYWLIPLLRGGVSEVLGAKDARDVEKLRKKGGWYADPVLGDDGDAQRLGATWAALEVLEALGKLKELPDDEKELTVRWLRSLAGKPREFEEAGALARSLHLLGAPVPEALTRTKAPRMDDFAELAPDARATRLRDTYGYVLVQEAAGRRPALDRTAWEQVLAHNTEALDYEQLFYLVHVLKAAGTPTSAFAAVRKRLGGNQLDDGTVRDPSAYLGNPDASLFVERLRSVAGWRTDDPKLLTALEREEKSPDAGRDGAERLNRAALRAVAGDQDTSEAAGKLCADATVLPRQVTEQNATQWQRTALTCHDAGVTVQAPQIASWRLDTPERVAAAATVVVGLHDAGVEDAVPSWITADALADWAANPDRLTSVYDYALVARAHALLGGNPDADGTDDTDDKGAGNGKTDAAMRDALRRGITPYRGCPGLPDLYRIGGDDPGCDLKTTWAVWTLDRQLQGALHALPAGSAEDKESE